MGDLIVMTRSTGQARRAVRGDASAEILFFTGVRYQRIPDHPIVVEPATQPRRRRSNKARMAAEARRLKRQA